MQTITLPRSAQAGPEMTALAPFYRDRAWTGTIEPGGMGPGSPAMSGTGRARCRLAPDGLWYECDFEQEQHLADGTFVHTSILEDTTRCTWRNEYTLDGVTWSLIEEYVMEASQPERVEARS